MPVVSIRQWPDVDPLAVPQPPLQSRNRPVVVPAHIAPATTPATEAAHQATAKVSIPPLFASQLLMLQQ